MLQSSFYVSYSLKSELLLHLVGQLTTKRVINPLYHLLLMMNSNHSSVKAKGRGSGTKFQIFFFISYVNILVMEVQIFLRNDKLPSTAVSKSTRYNRCRKMYRKSHIEIKCAIFPRQLIFWATGWSDWPPLWPVPSNS